MRKPKVHTLDSLRDCCEEVGQCWIWQGATDGKGRPQLRNGLHGTRSPRRLVRQLTDGKPVPAHLVVTCKCGDILCISSDCSVVATNSTTHKMAVARGSYRNAARDIRMALTKRAQSHISEDMVQIIRLAQSALDGHRQTGVSLSHCKAIRRGDARRSYSSPFAGLGG